MIYCVLPQALADDLYDKLVDYYKDDPNVKVIVDRRAGADRRKGAELSELEPADQIANAAADEQGELHLAAQHA